MRLSVSDDRDYIEVPHQLRLYLEDEARKRKQTVDELLVEIIRLGIAGVCGKGQSGKQKQARGHINIEDMETHEHENEFPECQRDTK